MRKVQGYTRVFRLVGAFAGVAVAFLLAAILTERSTSRIDDEADSIRYNSLPSVTHLTAARARPCVKWRRSSTG